MSITPGFVFALEHSHGAGPTKYCFFLGSRTFFPF